MASIVRLSASSSARSRLSRSACRCLAANTTHKPPPTLPPPSLSTGSTAAGAVRHLSNDVHDGMTERTRRLADAILSDGDGDALNRNRRLCLSRAITLVESRAPEKRRQADLLLDRVSKAQEELGLDDDVNGDGDGEGVTGGPPVGGFDRGVRSTFRVGIAGPPGAGKSSFIEKLGLHILGEDADGNRTRLDRSSDVDAETSPMASFPSKLAVVCIDPSSSRTGGSILGDKTRMAELSRHERAFVRPSPSSGTLGGVAAYTSDVVMLCQAAGFGLVLVETVGLGQSEVEVDFAVDMLVLLLPPGGGDQLQGVKKGIVEVADLLVVNKADGDLLPAARHTAADYRGAMKFQRRKVCSWEPPVLLASAHTGEGVAETWERICRFKETMTANGELTRKRRQQARHWMWKHIQDLIAQRTKNDPVLCQKAAAMEKALESGLLTPRVAASELLGAVLLGLGREDN